MGGDFGKRNGWGVMDYGDLRCPTSSFGHGQTHS